MKKRNIFISVALVLLVTLEVLTASASSQNSADDLLSTNSWGGIYSKSGLIDDYIKYTIEDSSCIIYNLNDTYLLVEDTKTDVGTCYWIIQIGNPTFREPELTGVSNKYLIFSVKNNSNTEKRIDIAVEIEETNGGYLNEYFHRAFMLDELTDEEISNIHAVTLTEN